MMIKLLDGGMSIATNYRISLVLPDQSYRQVNNTTNKTMNFIQGIRFSMHTRTFIILSILYTNTGKVITFANVDHVDETGNVLNEKDLIVRTGDQMNEYLKQGLLKYQGGKFK